MSKQLVYWDSATFISLFDENDNDRRTACEDVWAVCKTGKMYIITSTLTIAEVIHLKGIPKLDPAKRPLVNNFFRAEHIILKPLTRAIGELARDVVWDNSILPKDAVHIATAITYKIGTIHTFDKGLTDRKRIDVNGFSLTACHPHAQRQVEIQLVTEANDDKEPQ